MGIGFCYGVGSYDPYYGSACFRAVADNFAWPSIASQNSSCFSYGGFSSCFGPGFSFSLGSVFGGSCWSVPGGYYCSWNGPASASYYAYGYPCPYLPYFNFATPLNDGSGAGGGGGVGAATEAKPKKRAQEPVAEEVAPKKVEGEGAKGDEKPAKPAAKKGAKKGVKKGGAVPKLGPKATTF